MDEDRGREEGRGWGLKGRRWKEVTCYYQTGVLLEKGEGRGGGGGLNPVLRFDI